MTKQKEERNLFSLLVSLYWSSYFMAYILVFLSKCYVAWSILCNSTILEEWNLCNLRRKLSNSNINNTCWTLVSNCSQFFLSQFLTEGKRVNHISLQLPHFFISSFSKKKLKKHLMSWGRTQFQIVGDPKISEGSVEIVV